MKKKLCFITLVVFMFMLLFPYTALALNPSVIDNAGYLTDSEAAQLSARLDEIRSKYNIDVAVVIENTMSGYDAESTADDIFDYNGYGMGEGKDGIMLYISKNPRKYHYTTHGSGITVFNSRGLEYIDNAVLPYLQNDRYYDAIDTYADVTEELLEYAVEGKPYNEKDGTPKLITIAAVIFGPIVVALLLTGGKMKQMKTAVNNDYADSYMKQGSMNLSSSQDIFLYSVVNRTEKPKSEGTHTSSSGEMHGGRGGSY